MLRFARRLPVDIRFYATLRPIVGGKMISLDLPNGSTARDVLVTVGKRYPEIDRLIWDANGGLGDYIKVFVDGREIRYLQNLDTVVPPNAEVDVFPPAAGG
jgi:molybdopterin synthase sulfur carrier subunit